MSIGVRYRSLGVAVLLLVCTSCAGVDPREEQRLIESFSRQLSLPATITLTHVRPSEGGIVRFAGDSRQGIDEVADFFKKLGRSQRWQECADVATGAGRLLVFAPAECSNSSPQILFQVKEGRTVFEGDLGLETELEEAE